MPMTATDFYDAELAVAHLGLPRDAVISLKVRPVQWNDEHSQLWDAYVYAAEYERARKSLSGRKVPDIGMSDRATLLTAGEQHAMLIEHEPGPEIILLGELALATASIGLLKEVFSFFKELLKAVNEASVNRRKTKEPTADRYYAADGVILELRLKGDPRLLAGIALPVINDQVFEQFLREGMGRAKEGTEWEGFPSSNRETG